MFTPPLSDGLPSSLDAFESLDGFDALPTQAVGDPAPASTAAVVPRGLPNSDGASCYVNAPLQVILNSAFLREQLLLVHPNGGFDALFRSVDSTTTSADDVRTHRDAVVAYLRGVPNEKDAASTSDALIPMEGAAQSSEAMSVLLDGPRIDDSPIVGLYLDDAEYAKSPDGTIDEGYAIAVASKYIDGKRVFAAPSLFGVQTVFDMAELIGMPLTGFTYYTQGHYVAYVTKDAEWYLIDDSVVTPCDVDDIKKLPLAVPTAPSLDDPESAIPMDKGYGVEIFAIA